MHSKRRYKSCICSVVLGRLESFRLSSMTFFLGTTCEFECPRTILIKQQQQQQPSTLDMAPSPSTWNPRPSTLDPRQKDRLKSSIYVK